MSKADWIWMPHAAHFIASDHCQFHMATYLGNGYVVSTVGEYWPERIVREIHASIYDPQWHHANNSRKGDDYDHAYKARFGFEEIGMNRTYETMVFRAVPIEDHPDKDGTCCPYVAATGEDLDYNAYNDAKAAYDGHMELCKTWSRKRMPKNPPVIVPRAERMKQMKGNPR